MSNAILTTDRPCIKCGAIARYTNGKCKICANARSAAWRSANPEMAKTNNAAYYADNPDKAKAYGVAYYAANRDQAKATQAAYRAAYPDKVKANSAAWYAANPVRAKVNRAARRAANLDQEMATRAVWVKANPEALRIYSQNRRARKRANGGKLSRGLTAKLFKLQRGMCACCSLPLGDNYHLDHILPISLGGPNTDDNIQLLRQRCNNQKCAKHPVDFMQERGSLL